MPSPSIRTSIGGQNTYWANSGIGADALIVSGAGVLNAVMQTTPATSGRFVAFYDSNIATSGGPFAASGHKVVGVLGALQAQAVSGQLNVFNGAPVAVGFPFNAGLCAAAVGGSGGPSWSVTYTLGPNM